MAVVFFSWIVHLAARWGGHLYVVAPDPHGDELHARLHMLRLLREPRSDNAGILAAVSCLVVTTG